MPGRVNEGSTALYSAQLVDENGDDILLSDIVTLVLTLYNVVTGAIINSRSEQNVKNTNNVTVSSSGALAWNVLPADNPIINDALDTELHIALFQGTYGTLGAKALKHEFAIRVVNLSKVS